jgi:hypothetical protein
MRSAMVVSRPSGRVETKPASRVTRTCSISLAVASGAQYTRFSRRVAPAADPALEVALGLGIHPGRGGRLAGSHTAMINPAPRYEEHVLVLERQI